MILTFLAFTIGLVLVLALVPVLTIVARRVGLVDHPDKHRKLHTDAIPMVGGPALFLAAPIASAAMIYFGLHYAPQLYAWTFWLSQWLPFEHRVPVAAGLGIEDSIELIGLLIASALLLVVGLADDRFGIRGRQKLIGQFLAATVLIVCGYQFNNITFGGMTFQFGVFSVFIVYFWVIAAINSINLLDGADGIASTIGIVMSLAICAMALSQGKLIDAILAAAIAGSLCGFLKFNFPPAKAYLGDSGSMLIGLLLSALAIRCTFKQSSAYAFFAPIALLAIPFIDTGAAVIRRRLTGRSIFTVDRGHLHHALMKRGYSPRVSLLWVALLCTTTAVGGVLSLVYRQSEYAVLSIAIVLGVMIACRIFGIAEFQLISRRTNAIAKSFFRIPSRQIKPVSQSFVHVQGNRDWQDVWKQLCDFADEHQLNELTMDLNAPWLHESFNATRRRADVKRSENSEWFTTIPLVIENRSFGRVEIHGQHDDSFSHHDVIRNLLKVTRDIEESLVEAPPTPPATSRPSPAEILQQHALEPAEEEQPIL